MSSALSGTSEMAMAKVKFEIVDGRKRKARPCGELSIDSLGAYRIDIAEDAAVDDVPALFIPFIKRGERIIGDKWARRWVQDRICPPGRQNLGEVLRAHGLQEYDELALLRSSHGVSSQDDFIVREITDDSHASHPEATVSRRKLLGETIRDKREGLGLSQAALAHKVGIDQPHMSRIETGLANITIDLFLVIAEVLDFQVL